MLGPDALRGDQKRRRRTVRGGTGTQAGEQVGQRPGVVRAARHRTGVNGLAHLGNAGAVPSGGDLWANLDLQLLKKEATRALRR
jgi:hypothetical protein